MKTILKIACTAILATFSLNTFAQRIKLQEGDLSFLKDQKKINVEFTYDNMKVGKYDNEQDYVNKKKEEMNNKEAGKGDKWAKAWIEDRENRFKPQFRELFDKYCSIQTTDKGATKYTLIYKTTFTEPGYNIGISRKNAQHNAEVWIVETANKSKVLAKISIEKALGRDFWGADFDTGARIAETYADSGKALGKFIDKCLN